MTTKLFTAEDLAVAKSGILNIWENLAPDQRQNWTAVSLLVNERIWEAYRQGLSDAKAAIVCDGNPELAIETIGAMIEKCL